MRAPVGETRVKLSDAVELAVAIASLALRIRFSLTLGAGRDAVVLALGLARVASIRAVGAEALAVA